MKSKKDLTEERVRPSVQHVTVEDRAGQRIDNFLIANLKGVPKSRIYRMIRSGEVRINGSRCKPSTKLANADVVRIPPIRKAQENREVKPPDAVIERLQQSIIAQNQDTYILNKPAGLAVHGGTGEDYGIAEIMHQALGEPDLFLVHRLDKGTSGCLLIARNRGAMVNLNRLFRDSEVKKSYLALVEGNWPPNLTEVDAPLERYSLANGERRVKVAQGSQPAKTKFQVIEGRSRASYVEVQPVSGRTHQIRVHAQYTEHPILGDRKYGNRLFKPKAPRLMLHAHRLSVPGMGDFEAPIPFEFSDYWQKLKSQRVD